MEKIDEIMKIANYCLNCKTKPCTKGCPLGNNIPEFIKCIKEEKFDDAYDVLQETTVLSSICGRICPHSKQCEGNCVRGIKGNPVDIGLLESFVGDVNKEKNIELKEKLVDNKKVAIIGGGPSGLTAAAFLARSGCDVTIYEKEEKLGGILNYGIPDFRLDKKIINNTIDKVLILGIQVKSGYVLGKNISLEDLKKEYDAIYLAFGANNSCFMDVEGKNLDNVYGANELLKYNKHPDYKEKNVAIIGGGNVAIDIARTVKRLDAKSVNIIYRREEKQMPAEPKEIRDAKNEGVNFIHKANLVKIIGNGHVEKIELIKTELVKKEGETREYPVNIQNSNYQIDMDYVIMAIGSKIDRELATKNGLELNEKGYIKVDENYKTNIDGVFAGGDLIGGKCTVAWASKAGRDAAKNIVQYLM